MCGFDGIAKSGSTPNAMTISGSRAVGTIGNLALFSSALVKMIMAAWVVYDLSRYGQLPAFSKTESEASDTRRQSSLSSPPSPPPAASSSAVALRYASRPSSRDQYASKAGRFSIRAKWSPQEMCEPT